MPVEATLIKCDLNLSLRREILKIDLVSRDHNPSNSPLEKRLKMA